VRRTAWEDVADLSASFGIELDPWQENVLQAAMGERADGSWAARQIAVSAPRQNGKALDVATELLTANRGWVTMGDVVVGDLVFHPSGRAVRVAAVSEVMVDRPCFEVSTVDGRSVVADGQHLWSVTDKRREVRRTVDGQLQRWFSQRVLTTSEMHAEGVSRYAGGSRSVKTAGKRYRTNEYRFVLPQQRALDLPQRELPLDPYLFGAWLGDGTSDNGSLTTSGDDLPHWVGVVELCGFVPTVAPTNAAFRVGITCEPGPGRRSRSFNGRLRELGVLGDKHIPDVYLLASEKQRIALLQGLLDTDGSIDARIGQVEFCAMNRRLADGVLFLARSLGWRAVLNEGRATIGGRDCGAKYRVQFTPKLVDGLPPFRLERKLARVRAEDQGKGRMTVSVKSVIPVESRPVRCIQVDAEDGLFLAGRDLVVTHNSEIIVARALAGILLFEEQTIIVSAHQQDTAREVFSRILDLVDRHPSLERRVESVMRAVNREYIRFHSGQSIRFKARSTGAGRGFSCDCLLLDEAQILGAAAWSAILPTMSARPNPQAWLLGTPPTENDDGEVFGRLRKLGLEGKEQRVAYLEWSADPDDPIDDAETWAAANPAYGTRINYEAIATELASMSEDQFRLERLGIWPSTDGGGPVVKPARWEELVDVGPAGEVKPAALAVDMSHGRDISVAAAWNYVSGDAEVVHGEEVWAGADTAAVLEWIVGRAGRRIPVVVDSVGPAASLIPDLKARKVKVRVTSAQDMARSCGLFEGAVAAGGLTHSGQPRLAAALAGARKRPIRDAGGWGWDRRDPSCEIHPLVALTLALLGATENQRAVVRAGGTATFV
jgi:hypothetical protein